MALFLVPNFVLCHPAPIKPCMSEPAATPGIQATFTKAERLCGRLRMKEVVSKGRVVHEGPIKLVGRIMELPGDAPAQVAFAIPRRYMRKAVERNRMRRLMRESWRLDREPVLRSLREQGRQCAWLFIYQGRTPLTFSLTRTKISRSLDRWMLEHG
jgi:ribonuclease P protein component